MRYTSFTFLATLALLAGAMAASDSSSTDQAKVMARQKPNPPLVTKTVTVGPFNLTKICSSDDVSGEVAGVSYETKSNTPLTSISVMSESEANKLLEAKAKGTYPMVGVSCAQRALGCVANGSTTCSNSNPPGALIDWDNLCLIIANDNRKSSVEVEAKVQWLTTKTQTTIPFKPAPGSESCSSGNGSTPSQGKQDGSQKNGKSEENNQPQESGKSEESNQPQESGKSEESNQPQESGKSEESNQPQENDRSEENDQSQTSGKQEENKESEENESSPSSLYPSSSAQEPSSTSTSS